jgi:hypothetical protein
VLSSRRLRIATTTATSVLLVAFLAGWWIAREAPARALSRAAAVLTPSSLGVNPATASPADVAQAQSTIDAALGALRAESVHWNGLVAFAFVLAGIALLSWSFTVPAARLAEWKSPALLSTVVLAIWTAVAWSSSGNATRLPWPGPADPLKLTATASGALRSVADAGSPAVWGPVLALLAIWAGAAASHRAGGFPPRGTKIETPFLYARVSLVGGLMALVGAALVARFESTGSWEFSPLDPHLLLALLPVVLAFVIGRDSHEALIVLFFAALALNVGALIEGGLGNILLVLVSVSTSVGAFLARREPLRPDGTRSTASEGDPWQYRMDV